MTAALDTYPGRQTWHTERPLPHRAPALLRQVHQRYRIWRDRQHLQELPDYLLKDIGIGRSQIDSVTEYGLAGASRCQPPL